MPRAMFEEICACAQAEKPLEACGLIGGKDDRLTTFYACRNAAGSPTFFTIDPAEILKVMRRMDGAGEELKAIVHSHPATRAYPSPTDVLHSHYPDCLYLIVSLMAEKPVISAYTIRDGTIADAELALV